jgi:Transposase DDE domain
MLRNIQYDQMNIVETILTPILANISEIDKWQRDFLVELFSTLFSRQGRFNFENLTRYSKYNELTHRRQFSKYLDWFSLNKSFVDFNCSVHIGVIDCSFIIKSGKKTFGLDKFWSGVSSKAKQGLEISVLGCINTITGKAYFLDATQTPSGLSKKEGNNYSRTDFYLEQILDCLKSLPTIIYYVADGFYAKDKIINGLTSNGKHLITKLRSDANLKYLNEKPRLKGQRGASRKYNGKVDLKKMGVPELSKWELVGSDEKYSHLTIYTQKLYAVNFDRIFRVVLLLNTKTNKYVLLASTDTELDAHLITKYYQLRFQIEFIFRDAKQFMGLNDCQARDENKLDYHFNASLTAVNIARKAIQQDEIYNKSMNNFMRYQYNQKFAETIYCKLSQNDEFDLMQSIWLKAPMWGNLAA